MPSAVALGHVRIRIIVPHKQFLHPLTHNPHQFSFAAYVSKNISSISFMITIGSSESCPSFPYRCFTAARTKLKSTAAAICLNGVIRSNSLF